MSVFTLPDGRKVRLGRNRPKTRRPVLRFSAYHDLLKATTPPPSALDYATKSSASNGQVYGNDTQGDCVIAAKMHMVGVWTGNVTGKAQVGTTTEALSQYHSICGAGDNGCVMEDVLDFMKTKGITVGGSKFTIDGYVGVDQTNMTEIQVAILLMGNLDLGFNVPSEWMNNAVDGAVWDVPKRLDNIGGHCVPISGYNSVGVKILTWGMEITIAWKALANVKIVDTLYAILSTSWVDSNKMSPNGFNYAQLTADLAKLGGGEIPDIDPPLPPSPLPPPPPPGPGPNPGPTPTPTPAMVVTGTASIPAQTVSFHVPGPFGRSQTVTVTIPAQQAPVTGSAVQVSQVSELLMGATGGPQGLPGGLLLQLLSMLGSINPAVLGDVIALVAAIMSKDPLAIAAAIQKLMTDLGHQVSVVAIPQS